MRKYFFFPLVIIIALLLPACGGGSDGGGAQDISSNFVLRWNQIAIDSSGIDHQENAAGEQLGPTRASRAMALVHIAMFESLNAITPAYESFIGTDDIPTFPADSLSAELTLAQAARDVLVFVYPSQQRRFNAFLAEEIASHGSSRFTSRTIEQSRALGRAIAAKIISQRTNDGSELSTDERDLAYEFSGLPGRWRVDPFNPDQIPLGPSWAQVRPFVLASASQFRAPPPPSIDSAEYAEAYAEAFRLGGDGIVTPTERTPEQSVIGIFWAYDGTPSLCAPPRLYNQVTRALIRRHGPNDPLETARLLALVNTAMADAAISIWEAKYFYDFWRPVTAIQEADEGTGPTGLGDGNPLTTGDPLFRPFGSPASNLFENNFTPPFPTYPSGHAGFGGALFEVLRRYYGSDNMPFSFVSDEFNGVTTDSSGNPRPTVRRSYRTLSQAEEENGQSRIYLGIHFSFDKTSAIAQGRLVGAHVFENIYRSIR